MMRQRKIIHVGGRDITVHEFDAETAYFLLKWLEERGGAGLKAHELLNFKNEILAIVGGCIETDCDPIDYDAIGLDALMQIADGLQAVNQAFLRLLANLGKLPTDVSNGEPANN